MGTTYTIGQNANGSLNGTGASAEYVYVGTISGFQSGDTIGLMENGTGATPASLSYDATAGVLTIKDAGGNVLGALNIPNVSATDSFILTQQPSGPNSPGFTSQYTISLADVAATGASGDINSGSTYVNGAAPTAGGVVDIGTGKAKLTSGEQPVASTIVLGANPNATTHLSNSSLSITDDAIAANVTIDATDLGGTFSPGEATAMFGAIGANGAVNFAGVINVGAGDGLAVAVAGDATTNPGYFADSGVIDATGAIDAGVTGNSINYAFVEDKLGTTGNPTGTGFVALGTVNLSYAIFEAMAPDSGTSSTANGGTFNLSNNSILGVINTVLGTTIVNFNDATDSLLIGQNAGQYEFSGAINGFEQGDTIGLMTSSTSPATPSYLQYDSTTDELNVFNASGAQIGQLHLVGNFVTAGFALTQASSSTFVTANGYSSQYNITYSTPLYWTAGVTGEIDTGTNWVGGASPQSGGVAVLQAGTIDIDNSQFVPTPLTLDVGTSVANAYAASVSNIDVTQNFLPSNLTINNTSAGGSITSTSVNGPVIASRLDVMGFSTSDATINVGAGDAEQIRVMEQSPTSGSAFFDNEGVITVDGASGNYAALVVESIGANSGANSVSYGSIDLSEGFLLAAASDALPPGFTTNNPGYIVLSHASEMVASAALAATAVNFVDGSGDRLDIGPQGSGTTYQFGGSIYGFQSGDTIALQETSGSSSPTGVSFSTSNDVLTITILGANSSQLGQLQLVGNYSGLNFTETQTASFQTALGYSGEYDITVSARPYVWTSGAIADFATSSDWTDGTPPNGSSTAPTVATIGQGTVELFSIDTAPNNITFDVGVLNVDTQPTSTPISNLSVTDTSLLSGVTIDNTAPGGGNGGGNGGGSDLYLSGLDINGRVNFAGTINVGAGDAEFVTISPDSPTSTTQGEFNNGGTINLNGTANSQAIMLVGQSGAGGYADYGNVNVDAGVVVAEAADAGANLPGGVAPPAGSGFNLSNGGELIVANTVFSNTNVNFEDHTGRLLIGENANDQYAFGAVSGGAIEGFQAGNTIGLLENGTTATPTSLAYSNGVLTIEGAGGAIGALDFGGANAATLTTSDFVLLPPTTQMDVKLGYSSEYDIQLGATLASLTVDPNAPYQNSPYDIGQLNNSTWQPALVEVQSNATIDNGGVLNVDAATGATGGSSLVVQGALTVNSGGGLNIGVNAPGMTSQTEVSAASLTNAGSIDIASGGADAALFVNSDAGMGGQAGVLTGDVTLTGNAQLVFFSGGLTTIAANSDLTLSGSQAQVANGSYGQINGEATSSLSTIDSSGVLDLENGNSLFTNNALTNDGEIKLDVGSGSGGSNLSVGGELTNSGGVIDIGNSAMTTGDGLNVGGLLNSGVIQLTESPTIASPGLQLNGSAENSNLIEGAGFVSVNNGFQLTNDFGATIDANQSGAALTIGASASPVVNNGVLEANGGTLQVNAAVIGTGSGVITNGGMLQFGGAFNESVIFQGSGALVLSQNVESTAFTGMISGFGLNSGAGDSIDLSGVAYDANAKANLNPLNDVLTVSDNGKTLYTLHLSSSAAGEQFHLASYNNGSGTQITANTLAPTPTVSVNLTGNAGAAAASSFTQFLGFGDSNIDSGYFLNTPISNNTTKENLYQASKAAGGGIPTSVGGTMNSTLLAQDFGLTATPSTSNFPSALGTNYAASGATVTGALSGSLAPSITSQIAAYLNSTGGVANPDALYLLSGGGNDVKIADTMTTAQGQAYMISEANSFAASIETLHADGAQYILIDNMAGSGTFGALFSATLDSDLAAAGVPYIDGNMKQLVATIEANPSAYGFTNAAAPPAVSASTPYSPSDGAADINPNPGTGSGQIANSWSLYATQLASANAATTDLWADDEHLAAAGQQLEANYYKSLIETATPTVGETLTANPAVVNGSGSNFTYQWQALASGQTIWSNISGAMGSTFAVASAEIGDEIRVQTTFTDSSTGAVVSADSAPTLAVSTPCYCRGALILTDRGEVAVERLEVGDKVLTIGGESRPIKWMGTRSFDGRFVGGNRDILPICVRAGALEDNVPSRDLWLSPHHALYLEGVLIEAKDLVNGVNIVQVEKIERVDYFHVELASHDVIFAEGAAAETFVDNDSRAMFQNVDDYFARYPGAQGKTCNSRPFGPRLDEGFELHAARQAIALRAGVELGTATPGELSGWIESVTADALWGWARDANAPEAPVCLHVLADGCVIGRVLANRHRADLEDAGLGCGRHAFRFAAPKGVDLTKVHVELRRPADGCLLAGLARRAA